ncbi:MAG TPA: hypothetical protein VGO00_05575, partial [Kofleriaceae bacterium]|nr:hypothetical protein [Kofleriaceae bacterium]
MKQISFWLPLLAAASAYAAPAPHDVCMQQGFGVPTRSGPPAWTTLPNGSTFIDPSLDDPRWNQSTNRTFDIGGAMPPLRVRQLWAPGPTANTQYLYLSFISDLDPNTTTPRDVFIGFHRAHAGITGDDTNVTGYIFQVHLGQGGTAAAAKAMTYCGNAAKAECMTGDWWRMFRDFGGTTTLVCQGGASEMGEQFKEWDGVDPAHAKNYLFAPITWLDSGGVSAWRIDQGSGTSATQTWAVQLRMLVAAPDTAAAPSAITDGLEAASTMWYEATETVGTAQSVGKFPQLDAANDPNHTGVTSSICLGPT